MAFNEAVNSIMQGIEQGLVTPDEVEKMMYGPGGKPKIGRTGNVC